MVREPIRQHAKPRSQGGLAHLAASFDAVGKDGQTADVGVIPLPAGGPQMELANLNMWRGELQLLPAEKAESD